MRIGPDLIPGQQYRATVVVGLTQQGSFARIDHPSDRTRPWPWDGERGRMDDDRRDLAEVAGVEAEEQHRGLHRDRHDHLVGDLEAPRGLPALVAHHEVGQFGQSLALGRVEHLPVRDAAFHDRLPTIRQVLAARPLRHGSTPAARRRSASRTSRGRCWRRTRRGRRAAREPLAQRVHQRRERRRAGGFDRRASRRGTAAASRRGSASSLTSTTSSTKRRFSANEYGSQRGAPSESAIVRTASIDWGEPARMLRRQAVGALRLDDVHRRAGAQLLDRAGDAGGQPAAADRHDHRVERVPGGRHLVDELDADRRRAERGPRALERMHERATLGALDLAHAGERLVHVVDQLDLGAELAADLRRGRRWRSSASPPWPCVPSTRAQ